MFDLVDFIATSQTPGLGLFGSQSCHNVGRRHPVVEEFDLPTILSFAFFWFVCCALLGSRRLKEHQGGLVGFHGALGSVCLAELVFQLFLLVAWSSGTAASVMLMEELLYHHLTPGGWTPRDGLRPSPSRSPGRPFGDGPVYDQLLRHGLQ